MKLYKYYSFNQNSISSLLNEFCWYSDPRTFNDPFDTNIIDTNFLQEAKQAKILCLSSYNDSLLMWSHYANSHKGFCVEFTDYSDNELLELKQRKIFPIDSENSRLAIIRNAKPVKYMTTEEIEEFISDMPTDDNQFLDHYRGLTEEDKNIFCDKIDSSLFIKHKDWEYESEYRIINNHYNTMCFPGKITAVYFGMAMSQIDKRAITKYLNASPSMSQCNLFQMYRKKGTYSLTPRPFNLQNDCKDLNLSFAENLN
nr:DUF2971 domain-containing protein [Plesiomonas shigelloides]